MKKKIKHGKIRLFGALVALFLILFFFISGVLFNFALNREMPVNMVNVTDAVQAAAASNGELNVNMEYVGFRGTADDKIWYASGEDIYIKSTDMLKLHARVFLHDDDNKSQKYAIVCHGYGDRAADMAGFAHRFYKMGYNVLVPDARAHGESEGKYIGMGWPDCDDLLGWMDYIIARSPDCKIILHGVSMGGATVTMLTGEELPENVRAVIEDCGYTSVFEEFDWELKKRTGISAAPLLYGASAFSEVICGYGFTEASALAQVKKSRTPILFIHGTEDDVVPVEMAEKLFEAADCEKEKLIVYGAGHTESCVKESELYWATISDFLQKYV